jgi:DNA-binding response OmpR family regulator
MKVLIVEDDADIAINLYDFLKNMGYEPSNIPTCISASATPTTPDSTRSAWALPA